MSQDNNFQTISQAELLAIDALFKRIAERGRKIRSQAQKFSAHKQKNDLPTGQVVTGKNSSQVQGGK